MKSVIEKCNKAGKAFLNLIYPSECQICKVQLGAFKEGCLCGGCKGMIRLNLPPFCLRCGKSLLSASYSYEYCPDCSHIAYHFHRNWAVGHYEGVLKECVHLFKFKNRICLLSVFTELLLNFAKSYINISKFDAIVPVPLHKTKIRERSFNQAELLAKNFSFKIGVGLCVNNLVKIKHTLPQTGLLKDQRTSNVKGAFSLVDPFFFNAKNIILMDDVFTTGSTLNECAKILVESGARTVECLVLARGV